MATNISRQFHLGLRITFVLLVILIRAGKITFTKRIKQSISHLYQYHDFIILHM